MVGSAQAKGENLAPSWLKVLFCTVLPDYGQSSECLVLPMLFRISQHGRDFSMSDNSQYQPPIPPDQSQLFKGALLLISRISLCDSVGWVL